MQLIGTQARAFDDLGDLETEREGGSSEVKRKVGVLFILERSFSQRSTQPRLCRNIQAIGPDRSGSVSVGIQ
jgi:hypothetical protein